MTKTFPRYGFAAKILLAAVLAVPAVHSVVANGFRNPPAGGEELGQIGGKIASVDDASAISQNPANLVSVTNRQVLAAATIVNAEAKFTSPMGGSATTKDDWKFLPDVYGAWPVMGDKLAFGFGITTPFGQSTEWSKDSILRYTAPYYAEITVVDFTPTVAYRLNDQLSLGAGVDVFWSDFNVKQIYPWSAVTRDPAAPDGQAEFSADGEGIGGNVALTWDATKRQRVALTYHSPVTVDYDGSFRVDNIPPAVSMAMPMITQRSDFSTKIDFPAVAGLGYLFKATDKLKLEADVEWIEFSRYDDLPLNAHNDSPLLQSSSIPQNWKDTWTFGVGADWQLSQKIVLRAGYIYVESPIPDSTLAPTLPDADRHVVSIGIGYKYRGQSLDLAYAHSFFDDRNVQNNINPAYNGKYELTSDLIGVSYGYNF